MNPQKKIGTLSPGEGWGLGEAPDMHSAAERFFGAGFLSCSSRSLTLLNWSESITLSFKIIDKTKYHDVKQIRAIGQTPVLLSLHVSSAPAWRRTCIEAGIPVPAGDQLLSFFLPGPTEEMWIKHPYWSLAVRTFPDPQGATDLYVCLDYLI